MISSLSSSSSSSQCSLPEIRRLTPPKRLGKTRESVSVAVRKVQENLFDRFIYKIKNPEMVNFIEQLIQNLDEIKNLSEINKLKNLLLKNDFINEEQYCLSIMRLSILNENNPLIETLKSLDSSALDRLRKIDVPPFFHNFFEELEFHIAFHAATQISKPEESVKALIPLAQRQLQAGKKSHAIKLIDIMKGEIYHQAVPPLFKAILLQEIASLFFKHENQEFGIQILKEAQEVADNIAIFSGKRRTLKKLTESFVHFQDWDSAINIINKILQAANLSSEASFCKQKNEATTGIFEFIVKHAGTDILLQIIPQCMNCLEKDLALVGISLYLLEDARKTELAIDVAQLIQAPRIKTKILEDLKQKSALLK